MSDNNDVRTSTSRGNWGEVTKRQKLSKVKVQRPAEPNADDSKVSRVERRKEKKAKKRTASRLGNILECARELEKRGVGIKIYERGCDGNANASSDVGSELRCFTKSGSLPSALSSAYTEEPNKCICVKPLVILDLNGILCKRVRFTEKCNGDDVQKYFHVSQRHILRSPVGHIAGTPIIARLKLTHFLEQLDSDFALAVWSSAKRKTTKSLVDLLFPKPIARRLVFVWGQENCTSISQKEGKANVKLYEVHSKPLRKVWDKYHFWDSSNTLLIDDSPEKCSDFEQNTVNPPPINGVDLKYVHDHGFVFDEVNEIEQERFFRNLAHLFRSDMVQTEIVSPKKEGIGVITKFLRSNATPSAWVN